MYARYIKRVLDIILSALGMIALSPFMLLIALAVWAENHSSPIFTQKRFGRDRKMIYIRKFKTMRDDAPHDVPTDQMENPEKYVTKIGYFLRLTSLDELPQLWNILKGDMSVIGPRPALWNQYHLMDERDKVGANRLRPGLSGLAQINGRDMLSDEEKAAYDGEYARNVSLWMDIKCLSGTFFKVLRHEGVKKER